MYDRVQSRLRKPKPQGGQLRLRWHSVTTPTLEAATLHLNNLCSILDLIEDRFEVVGKSTLKASTKGKLKQPSAYTNPLSHYSWRVHVTAFTFHLHEMYLYAVSLTKLSPRCMSRYSWRISFIIACSLICHQVYQVLPGSQIFSHFKAYFKPNKLL